MFALKFMCFCAVLGQIYPAAIPMWEYLSKDEKMSYLYSMFENQVEEFCEFSDMRNCNQELLKFGLTKLKVMPEDHLDTMDPYQRGAHSLIWDSMMEGHEMMNKKPKSRPTTTAKPNSYEDQSFGQDYQSEASAKIETVYRIPPPVGFTFNHPQYTIASGPSQYIHSPEKIYTQNKFQNGKYQEPIRYQAPIRYQGPTGYPEAIRYQAPTRYQEATRYQEPSYQEPERFQEPENYQETSVTSNDYTQSSNDYTKPSTDLANSRSDLVASNHESAKSSNDNAKLGSDYINIPLTGPMVVRVHLDGSPVNEQTNLPQDEDLRQYKMSKARLPDF